MNIQVNNVRLIVESMGYKIIAPEYYDNIYNWLAWYKGKVDDFHNYTQYNGHEWINRTRYSLNMPKVIAEDWATLLYNDRTAIKVNDSDQATLDEILADNKFESRFSNLLEMTMALGYGATVEYNDSKGNPKINYIMAPMVFPLRVEYGEVVDCAFASVVDKDYYINVHLKQKDGSYKITNSFYTFDANNQPYEDKKKLIGIRDKYTSKVKLFQIFKPCIANNIDLFVPYGVSVFGNAVDRVKACDLIYDSLRNEFVLGKKRLFLRQDLLDYKPIVKGDGTTVNVPTFDNNDTEFYSLPTDDEANGEQIKEVNPNLRITEHTEALQSALNMLSDICGLGNDRYQFKDSKTYTNTTQVISTQSKLYKTLLKHEKEIRGSMVDMVKALMFLKKNSEYNSDVTIDFDDSIVEDTAVIQKRAQTEFSLGIIDQVEYVIQVYKYTEEQAQEFVEECTKRMIERQQKMAQLEPNPEENPNPEGAEGNE